MFKPIERLNVKEVIGEKLLKLASTKYIARTDGSASLITLMDAIYSPYILVDASKKIYISNELLLSAPKGFIYYNGISLKNLGNYDLVIRLAKNRLLLIKKGNIYLSFNEKSPVYRSKNLKFGGVAYFGFNKGVAVFKVNGKYITINEDGIIKHYAQAYAINNYLNSLLIMKNNKNLLIKYGNIIEGELITYNTTIKDEIRKVFLGVGVGGVILASEGTLLITPSTLIKIPIKVIPLIEHKGYIVVKDYKSSRLYIYGPEGLRYITKLRSNVINVGFVDDSVVVIDSYEARILHNNVWRVIKLPLIPKNACVANNYLIITNYTKSYAVNLMYPYTITELSTLSSCASTYNHLVISKGNEVIIYNTEEVLTPSLNVLKSCIDEKGPAKIMIKPFVKTLDIKVKADNLITEIEKLNNFAILTFKPSSIKDSYNALLIIDDGLRKSSYEIQINLKKPLIQKIIINKSQIAKNGYLRGNERFNGYVSLNLDILNTLKDNYLAVDVYINERKVGSYETKLKLGINALKPQIPIYVKNLNNNVFKGLLNISIKYLGQVYNIHKLSFIPELLPTPKPKILISRLEIEPCTSKIHIKLPDGYSVKSKLVCNNDKIFNFDNELNNIVNCLLPLKLYMVVSNEMFQWFLKEEIDNLLIDVKEVKDAELLRARNNFTCVNGLLIPRIIVVKGVLNPIVDIDVRKEITEDNNINISIKFKLRNPPDLIVAYDPQTNNVSVLRKVNELKLRRKLGELIDGTNLWIIPVKGGVYWVIPLKISINFEELIRYCVKNSLKLFYYIGQKYEKLFK